VGRYALAATSLVAALPAAFLAYLSIMAFVQYTENMSGFRIGVNAAITGVSVLMAISPIVILVGRRREKTDDAAGSAEDASNADEEDAGADDAVATATKEAPSTFDDEIEAAETDAYDFNADEFDDADAMDDGDQFEFDDEEENQ
jgi:hypothetical protein